MTSSLLELRGRLGSTDAAGWVLTTDTDADKEAPGGEHVEHADGAAFKVGAGC